MHIVKLLQTWLLQTCRLHNLNPWYWNSLSYGLISSEENSVHFLQLMPFTILRFSFNQVPMPAITAGWTGEACPTPLHMAGGLIETEGYKGVMSCLGQGDLRSPWLSVLSIFFFFFSFLYLSIRLSILNYYHKII